MSREMIRKSIGVTAVLSVLVAMTGLGFAPDLIYSDQWVLGMVFGLGSISLYLKLQYNLSIGTVIKFLAMPFGFYISLIYLSDVVDGGTTEVSVGLAPSLLGGFLSALFLDAKSNEVMVPRWSRKIDVLFFLICIYAIVFVVSQDGWWVLWHPFGWVLVFGCPVAIFCFADITKRLDERLLDASLFGILVVVAISVLAYLTLVATNINETDMRTAQRGVATLLAICSFGFGLYVCALLYSISVGNTQKIVRSNWHIAEGYVFIVFIYFAPKSLIF